MTDKHGGDEQARLARIFAAARERLPADGGPLYNRLIFASSPYLLQHADNPVDWHEWGAEAFDMARVEDKPIFLSIGYATCHWCHVMAHESFADAEVAEVMNRYYVAIKVDREERPDIDDLYMKVSQVMTGSGGWPLNVIMTPDREPFFTITYLPKMSRSGSPGLVDLLENVALLWQSKRELVVQNCRSVLEALKQESSPRAQDLADARILDEAFRQLAVIHDGEMGGFGSAPKFPMPLYHMFLLRYWRRTGNDRARSMVEKSLRAMRSGGIFDQAGYGFHRYAVDRQWLVPHFEKMLYDQALLALAYLETFQATGVEYYRRVGAEVLEFALRELVSPEGGFYAGLDADSEGKEGTFYVWTLEEVVNLLGELSGRRFCKFFALTDRGNFEGKNILSLPLPLHEFAAREGVDPGVLAAELEESRLILLKARDRRVRPFRDEKIVAGWNGLMMAALARGGIVCGTEELLAAARKLAECLMVRLRRPDGRLVRSWHRGETSVAGFLEDYAFVVWGLLELYESTLQQDWLIQAIELSRDMLQLFDGGEGPLHDAATDAEKLPVRLANAVDGVIPSGNSVAAVNLLRLAALTSDSSCKEAAEKIIRAFSGDMVRQPVGHVMMLVALDLSVEPPFEVTIYGDPAEPHIPRILHVVKKRFIPNLVVRLVSHAAAPEAVKGGWIASICAGSVCHPAATTVEQLEELLDQLV